MLGYRITKGNKKYCCVTPIKDYTILENNYLFMCEKPVIYTELDGRQFSGDLLDIVEADFSKVAGNIGTLYRMPLEYVTEVKT